MKTAGTGTAQAGSMRGGSLSKNGGNLRSSGRQRKQSRAQRARKAVDQLESTQEQQAYRDAVHIDALEEAMVDDDFYSAAGGGPGEEDGEYFEDEFGGESEGVSPSGASKQRGGKRARTASASSRRAAASSSGRAASRKPSSAAAEAAEKEKRLRPRSLASILIEEAAHPEGNTSKYLAAEARLTSPSNNGINYPKRKFCPVTGLFGIYTDPKTRIPYATLDALEQIRERQPPWMNLSGSAAYHEACKSLRNED
jgi:hypothetical protein